MEFKTENKYKVYFKDGTSFESNGSSSSTIRKSTLENEFSWVAFHIGKEVRLAGKALSDILRIEYSLDYSDE